jgi:hypothetical protein
MKSAHSAPVRWTFLLQRPSGVKTGTMFGLFVLVALLLKQELESRMKRTDLEWEWKEVIRGLDALQQVEAKFQGRRFLFRSQLVSLLLFVEITVVNIFLARFFMLGGPNQVLIVPTCQALEHPLTLAIGGFTIVVSIHLIRNNYPGAAVAVVLSSLFAVLVMPLIWHKKFLWSAVSWLSANVCVLLSLAQLAKK